MENNVKSNSINYAISFESTKYRADEFRSGSLSTLSLKEVGEIIKIKGIESIKKWLSSVGVKVYKLSNLNYVYKIDVDCEIDKIRVRDLRLSYPDQWEKRYKIIAKDESVYKMVVLSLSGEINYAPTSKVKRMSKSDEKLYQKLVS